MKLSPAESWLVAQHPLMICGNRLEFQQRLQWLSNGYLRNHMLKLKHPTCDPIEVALYKAFKQLQHNGGGLP